MLIDAHQHFWRVGAEGFEWPTPDLGPIYRDYSPADLEALARPVGVVGSVLVQAQPSDADTDWMLQLAERTPFVLGVVGWADLAAPDAPDRVRELAARPKLKGLRPMLQGLPQDDWILSEAVRPALEAMAETGLTLDALVFTRHLRHVASLAAMQPGLRIVIDHGAKPPVAARSFGEWATAIEALAAFPQVFCKLSGLLTEGLPGQPEADFAPYVRHLVGCFGPDRLMWGSDWPVVELRAEYGAWLDMALRLSGLEGEDLDSLRHGAARRFYRLEETA